MNIYVISPVRTGEDEWRQKCAKYVADLEDLGHKVHYPIRDTKQDDPTGMRICLDNMNAIQIADEIHFLWDGQSQGSLFDLGIAFALRKKLVCPDGFLPQVKGQKSFPDMASEWSKNGFPSNDKE